MKLKPPTITNKYLKISVIEGVDTQSSYMITALNVCYITKCGLEDFVRDSICLDYEALYDIKVWNKHFDYCHIHTWNKSILTNACNKICKRIMLIPQYPNGSNIWNRQINMKTHTIGYKFYSSNIYVKSPHM